MEVPWHIGDAVRKIREDVKGWTQEELAERSKISVATVRRLEAGGNQTRQIYEKVATGFQIPVEELWSLVPLPEEKVKPAG